MLLQPPGQLVHHVNQGRYIPGFSSPDFQEAASKAATLAANAVSWSFNLALAASNSAIRLVSSSGVAGFTVPPPDKESALAGKSEIHHLPAMLFPIDFPPSHKEGSQVLIAACPPVAYKGLQKEFVCQGSD